MKKKTITLVIYMLVCISLVSVGFAAWIITGGTSTETSASITASTVTDKSLNIAEEKWTQGGVETDAAAIVFGIPSNAQLKNTDWLRFDDVPAEKLEATYSFTLKVGDGTANDKKLSEVFKVEGSSVEFAINQQYEAALTAAVRDGYLVGPVVTYYVGNTKVTDKEEDGTEDDFLEAIKAVEASSVNIKVEISFNWGSKSDSKNPYTYFNTEYTTPSTDNKNAAKEYLNSVFGLNGATYTLSIVLEAERA